MPSASAWIPGPLTTIFTPPTGCFDKLPQVWGLCDTATPNDNNISVSCYWSLPTRCYPPGAATVSLTTGFKYLNAYHYSPGVLPSGFTSWLGAGPSAHAGVALSEGCLSGWGGTAQNTWCVSPIVGDYVLHSTTTHSGTFAALLPVVIAWWASSDLPFFTPASAPVLPTWRIERYESSVAARSRSAVATSTAATNPTSSNGSTPKSESNASSTEHNGAGLSPGTKAGIAVGIVIAVLIVLVVGFLVLRQRRRRTTNEESPTLQRRERKRPYLDSKSELPASAKSKQTTVGAAELGPKSPQELHADTEPQELAASQEDPLPPPIPLASKPRFEGSGGN